MKILYKWLKLRPFLEILNERVEIATQCQIWGSPYNVTFMNKSVYNWILAVAREAVGIAFAAADNCLCNQNDPYFEVFSVFSLVCQSSILIIGLGLILVWILQLLIFGTPPFLQFCSDWVLLCFQFNLEQIIILGLFFCEL